jgi:hypothetical protein
LGPVEHGLPDLGVRLAAGCLPHHPQRPEGPPGRATTAPGRSSRTSPTPDCGGRTTPTSRSCSRR